MLSFITSKRCSILVIVAGHFKTMHSSLNIDYLLHTELRRMKLQLQTKFVRKQAIFVGPFICGFSDDYNRT